MVTNGAMIYILYRVMILEIYGLERPPKTTIRVGMPVKNYLWAGMPTKNYHSGSKCPSKTTFGPGRLPKTIRAVTLVKNYLRGGTPFINYHEPKRSSQN